MQPTRQPDPATERLELEDDGPAAVAADGSRALFTPPRAEIPVPMGSRSQGWSAEELAYELHDDGRTRHVEGHLQPGLDAPGAP